MMQISQGTIGTPWPQSYHSSSSTSDLSNYDHAYLRRSPDQCSSQGSMESLEPSGGYPACHLLSPAKSTSSIDQLGHLHNKRDSAYSSFSTSSSILEYPPPGVPGRERSGSMDTSAQGGLLDGMRQADIRYVKTVYDPQRGVSAEYEVNSSALLLPGREAQASADSQGYDKGHHVPRGRRGPPPSWSQQGSSSLETAIDNLPPKVGAPLPPARSDSYAAFRHRERPSSWSSLDQKRFCRPQANSAGALKSPFVEEQLHTVLEKSPESSPPVKPKHQYPQKAQPGQPLLPTGIYPVPSLEPHFAQVPQPSASSNGTLYPALAKESGYPTPPGAGDKTATLDENGNQNGSSRPAFAFCQPREHESLSLRERTPETPVKCAPLKVHFPSAPENVKDTSPKKRLTPLQGSSPHPSETKSPHSSRPAPTCHRFQPPQAQAWQVGDGKRPSRPTEFWEGDSQEDHNANLQQGLEREGPSQSPSSNFGKTKSAFSSLQNIPESLRRQSSLEVGGSPKAEGPGRKVVPDHRSHPDRPVSCPRPEGKASAVTSVPLSEARPEEPPSPPHPSSLGRRRLSSSSTSALPGFQYGQPHCSVLEKVSKIEQREQGRQRPPSVGSSVNGCTYRPSRMAPASRNDFQETNANIRFSEPTEPLGNGEHPFKNGDPKLEDVSWQPCAQRELPGGPNGNQKMDRTPGEPSSWGAAAGRAGKSMSAEDLLERSDFLVVPVHVRSRSSPITHQKLQDVLLGSNNGSGLVKDPCYLAGPGPRSLGCPERGEEEMLVLKHQPSPRWGGSGCKAVGASIPSDCPRQLDPQRQASRMPCPRPLPTGLPGHLTDTRAGPLTPLSSALPSPAPSSYCPQAAGDQPTGRDGQPGQQPLPPYTPAVTHRSNGHSLAQPPRPRGQEPHSPERGAEEGKRKQPPPPRVKWAHTVRENSLPEESCSPESASLKHYKKQQNLPSSSSTSDPDTPLGVPSTPGRISLRISESVLQASPLPREDYEDEVFVKDLHPSATSHPTFRLY
ncbi:Protein Shroom3 [Myotis brandtii]|uniref:Protein Shroom3 n=1 Tax=Myotis brandtii TaxID=109478 RepID=S7P3Q1_MYOBR|nr:Protein Shroom3 [Myotis brandtii]